MGADENLAMVRNGKAFFALLRLPEGERPLQGSRSQKGHVAMRVSNDEFSAFKAKLPDLLKSNQVNSEQSLEIEEDDYGIQQSLFFEDPDGNELEVTTWVQGENDSKSVDFLRDALLLDVRSPDESLHVPHVAILDASAGGLEKVLDAVDGDLGAPIAAYCAAGIRSASAMEALKAKGFTNVENWVSIEHIVRNVGKPS